VLLRLGRALAGPFWARTRVSLSRQQGRPLPFGTFQGYERGLKRVRHALASLLASSAADRTLDDRMLAGLSRGPANFGFAAITPVESEIDLHNTLLFK
jgi:hypothetical protein